MPKWSSYIRNLGTATQATREGIEALGFLLASNVPGILAKFVRVDAVQTFTNPEKTQGRANLGLGTISTQDANTVDITGGSIAGITDLAIADGGTGASTATAARANLGLDNVNNTSDASKPVSTATQSALNLKAPLASPALTGTPTAPTATVGTETTQIATAAFVQGEKIVRQTVSLVSTASVSWTTAGPSDTGISLTLPANLKSTSSKVRIRVELFMGANGEAGETFEIRRNTTSILTGGNNGHAGGFVAGVSTLSSVAFEFDDTPGSTIPATYRLYRTNVAGAATTRYLGRRGADTAFSVPTLVSLTELVNVP